MKRWVSAWMLLSLFGSVASPILASAVESTESSAKTSVNEGTTVQSITSDPQQTVPTESAPVPEKAENPESTEDSDTVTNQLAFEKTSKFSDEVSSKNQTELQLDGKVTSSAENTQAITFEMSPSFKLTDSKPEEKVIVNDQKEPIGHYTVETKNARSSYTLTFNKLVKGENKFKLILLGTITRGPDKTVDLYQGDQKIFQLALPDETDTTSEDTTASESTETSTTESASSSTTASKESTKSSQNDATKESTEASKSEGTTKNEKKRAAPAAEPAQPRAPGSIDELFSTYAPGDNFVQNIKLNFEPNPPTINSTVQFNMDFAIPDAVRTEMVSGDYYEMDFPEGLAITTPSPQGDLKDGDGNVYGRYIFDAGTQKLRITFTQQEGQNFLPPETGSVTADVRFDTKKITQPGPATIIYPSKTNIPPFIVQIKPTGGTSISKAGHTDTPNNPNTVYWDVDFNKDFSELEKPLLTEKFPDQVTFNKDDLGAVAVYPLEVDFNGNVTSTGTTPLDPSTYTVADNGSIQFNTTIDRPYRVVYSTTIKDAVKPTNGGTVPITNNVTLTSGSTNLPASATVQLNYKKALEKVRIGYDSINQEYRWLIRYNYGQKELANDTVVSDTYSSNMDVEPNSFDVYTVNFDNRGNPVNGAPLDPKDYTIDTTTNPFTVSFKNNVQAGKAINISYKTRVNKIVSGASNNQITVSNQAKTNTIPPTTEVTTTPTQQVVIKNKPTIDVGTKTARYVIDINKNKYEMENALFTDKMSYTDEGYASFPTKVKQATSEADAGVVIRDVSANNRVLTSAFRFVATDGEVVSTIGDPETADYVVSANLNEKQSGYTNFTVKFQNAYAKTTHQFQMEYYITYNQFDDEVENTSIDYRNTMTANFINNGQPYESSSTTDFKTSTQEVNQGMKSGSYDPVTKEITWTIVTNYNNLGVSQFTVTDPITGNQVYEPDSLEITRGTINSSGRFQPTTKSPYQGNQVGQDYLTVTNPVPTAEDQQGTLAIQLGKDGNYIPGWNADDVPMVYQIQFKTSLKNQIVYNQSTYNNVATVDITGNKQELPASVSIAFGGQSALKEGNYNTQNGKVDWAVTINPNQSLLANVKIEDNPSANQIIQGDSFKLYTGKYSGTGNATTVQKDQLVPSDQYKVTVTTDPTTGQQRFVLDMSEIQEKKDPNQEDQYLTGVIEKPYILAYETEPNFTSRTETVANDASISSEGKELPGKDTHKDFPVTIQDSSGTAFGSKGKVVVQKVNGNGGVVPGAVLQLLRKNTSTNKTDVLYETTTDNQGLTTFGNLIATSSAYEYYVKEIEAPDGYTISPELLEGKRVYADTSSNTPVTTIENEPVNVTFKKTNAAGNALSGGLFSLYENNGTAANPNYAFLRGFIPTSEGFDLSGLGDGQYRIRETSAPSGYQINLTPIDFEIKKNSDATRSVFVNDEVVSDGLLQLKDYRGSALLKKSDESGKALGNAKFNVQRAELNSDDYSDYGNQDSYVTANDGELKLSDLPPGKYKVKESQAPENYYLNSKEFTFVIDAVSTGDQAPATVELNNGDALIDYQGSARFKKVDGQDYLTNQKETPLSGAKFQLYDAEGKTAIGDEVTTGSDGYLVFDNLKPGTTYAFKETKAPSGYLKNDQLVRFTTPVTNNQGESAVSIESGGDQKLVVDEKTPFKNYKERVHFRKEDEAGRPLADAEYQLSKQNDANEWQPVTDLGKGAGSDGLFTSDKLDGSVNAFELSPGKYKFVEKTAPSGYLLNTKEIPFTVEDQEEGEPQVLEIPISGDANVNYQGSAVLYKEAEDKEDTTFNKLEDAAFDVYTDSATPEKVTEKNLTSDSDGNVTATGLAPGNYYFQEVSNGNRYLVNTQKIKFTIPTTASGKPETVTTNADNKLSLRNYLGTVELTKVDANEQPLKNAEFTVFDSSEKEVGKGSSNQEGKVTINKLAPGDYTMKETKAPAGYLLNDQTVTFTIPESAEGQPQKVAIPDSFKDYKGAVKLIKTDANDQPLANAVFELLDSDDQPVGGTATSNENGEVVFDNLAPGNYTFKEINAPDGYVKNTTLVPVTVPETANGQPEVVTVRDHFVNYQGTAELTKTDGEGNALQGAVFKVIRTDGSDVEVKTATSDEKGLVQVTGLAPGSYRFVETAAPDDNYVMTSEALDFTIPTENEGQPDVVAVSDNVPNYRGTIRVHKVGNDLNDDSKMVDLAGAEFTLYTNADFSDTNPTKVVSDSKGNVAFKDLAPGTYYVKETKAPNGYLVNTFPMTFVIPDRVPETMPMTDAQNHENRIEDGSYVVDAGDFQNARKNIELKKTDGEKDGNLDLTKVAFSLYFDDGTTTGKLVKEKLQPETDGTIDLSNLALEDGSYKLIETQTSENYVLSSQPIYFVVENSQAKGISLNIANYQAVITGKKVGDGKGLAGAEYQLFKANNLDKPLETTDQKGTKQTILKSDSKGAFYAKGLSVGEYVLKETKAPNGYILDTTTHKFTIYPQNGKPAVRDLGEFENYQGRVRLTKVDAANENNQLSNAEFQLLDENQHVLQENLKTGTDGRLTVTHLAPGTYFFKETKAPSGYRLSEKQFAFTVEASHAGKPVQIEVTAKNDRTPNKPNHPKQPNKPNTPGWWHYPKTGETKGPILLIVGALLVLAVIGIGYYRKRN